MKVEIENRKSFIHVRLTGQFTPKNKKDLEESKGIVLQTFEEAKKNQISKLLFDASNVSTILETIDRYYLMSSLARVYIDYLAENSTQPLKIAFLSNKAWDDPHKFDETVARNRAVNVIVTRDMEEALKWLGVEAAYLKQE